MIFKQILIGAALMALAVIGRVGLRVEHILRAAPSAIPKSQDGSVSVCVDVSRGPVRSLVHSIKSRRRAARRTNP